MGHVPIPFVPGHEVTGTVVALGEGAKGLKSDKRVDLAGPLIAVSHATNVFPVTNTCAPLLRGPLLGAMAALRIVFELSGRGFALCPMRWTLQKWDRSCAAGITVFSPFLIMKCPPPPVSGSLASVDWDTWRSNSPTNGVVKYMPSPPAKARKRKRGNWALITCTTAGRMGR